MIERLDHLVLTVADVEATAAFYARVLGMERRVFGEGRVALHFGQQKINLHEAGGATADIVAQTPTPGSADLCFIASDAMADVLGHLLDSDVKLEEGPIARTGATGPIESVYFRDPDGNLIEVSVPHGEAS